MQTAAEGLHVVQKGDDIHHILASERKTTIDVHAYNKIKMFKFLVLVFGLLFPTRNLNSISCGSRFSQSEWFFCNQALNSRQL